LWVIFALLDPDQKHCAKPNASFLTKFLGQVVAVGTALPTASLAPSAQQGPVIGMLANDSFFHDISDVYSTGEAFSPHKRTSSTSKNMIALLDPDSDPPT
jgi:hypothetical protein